MRKSLLKAMTATVIVGATMALSSVAAWADVTAITTNKTFTTSGTDTSTYLDIQSSQNASTFKIDKWDKLASSNPKTVLGNYVYFTLGESAEISVTKDAKAPVYIVPSSSNLSAVTGKTNKETEFTTFQETYIDPDPNTYQIAAKTETNASKSLSAGSYYMICTGSTTTFSEISFSFSGSETPDPSTDRTWNLVTGADKGSTWYENITEVKDYNGLKVDVTNGGKFYDNSNSFQIGANTKISVPLTNADDIVAVTPFSGYEPTIETVYYNDYAVLNFTVGGYITEIAVTKENTPALSLSGSGNTLTGTILNPSADNEISSIKIYKSASETASANITKIKDNEDGTYSFNLKVKNSTADRNIDFVTKLVYGSGDTTVNYGFRSVGSTDGGTVVTTA